MIEKADVSFIIHWAEGKTTDPIHSLASEKLPEPKRLTYDELNRTLLSFEARSDSDSYNKTKLSIVLPEHMVKALPKEPDTYGYDYLFTPDNETYTIPGNVTVLNEKEVAVHVNRITIGTPDTDPEHFDGLDAYIKRGQSALLKALAKELSL